MTRELKRGKIEIEIEERKREREATRAAAEDAGEVFATNVEMRSLRRDVRFSPIIRAVLVKTGRMLRTGSLPGRPGSSRLVILRCVCDMCLRRRCDVSWVSKKEDLRSEEDTLRWIELRTGVATRVPDRKDGSGESRAVQGGMMPGTARFELRQCEAFNERRRKRA